MYLTEQQFDNSGNSNQYSNVREAFELFKNTQIAFAHCEANGIQIDKEFLDRAIKETNERLDSIKNYIYEKTKVGQRIREIFGSRALLTNRNQVAVILFKGIPESYYKGIDKDEVKKRCFNLKPVLTSAGSPIVSETELEKINNPDIADFAKQYSLYMSLHKMLKTNLEGILAGLDENAIIHPSFLLFSVISYRTSCVAEGTPIITTNEQNDYIGVPIEKLKVGDKVYCYDDDLRLCVRDILWVGKTGCKKVVRVYYRNEEGREGYIDVTPEHKLRALDGAYVRADSILKYEKVACDKGYKVLAIDRTDTGVASKVHFVYKSVRYVYKVEELNDTVDVYDITVDEHHNFIANEIAIKNSSEPNFQNFPNHNKELSSIVRKCFIPRGENRYLCEVDYSGAEVRVNASINQDPTLVGSITHGVDFHKAIAAKSYMLDESQVTKKLRQSVKGTYTFAAFYGSYWGAIAKGLWDNINYGGLTLEDGTPLLEHIHSKGIYKLGDIETPEKGTYGEYIYNVDQWFWGVMFKRYAQWKYETWEDYQCTGYVDLPSGFRCGGIFTRNMVSNMPAQGCLKSDSRVLTENGWVPIKELVGVHTKVWTGFKWVDGIGLDMGEAQLAEIELENGQIIKCDVRHKLKNEQDVWVDFNDLKVGQYVALPKLNDVFEKDKQYNWWYFAGFCLGDACMYYRGKNKDKPTLVIKVGDKKACELKEMYKWLLDQVGDTGIYYREYTRPDTKLGHKRQNGHQLYITNASVIQKLQDIGMSFGVTAHTKRVPEGVWRANKAEQISFLTGYLAADGGRACVDKRNGVAREVRRVHTPNKLLLLDLAILCSGFGLQTTGISKTTTGYEWFYSNKYDIQQHCSYPVSKILQYVPKIDSKLYTKEEYIKEQSHRNALRRKYVCYGTACEILDRHGIKYDEYRYTRIKEIRVLDEVEHTYTMSVDDDLHQFVADGVITHNSSAHCLLWSFCQLTDFINKWGVYKDRYGCRLDTKICGQIHDSILLDIPEKELDYILYIANKIMTKDLREHFKWITVPMEIEADVSPKGKSWLEKEPYQIPEKEVPFPYSKEEIEEINKQEVERVKKMGLDD